MFQTRSYRLNKGLALLRRYVWITAAVAENHVADCLFLKMDPLSKIVRKHGCDSITSEYTSFTTIHSD